MMIALVLAAAQPAPAAADPFDAYVACNLDHAKQLIAAGEPDDVVRDRSFESCHPLRAAAVAHIQSRSKPRLSSGALGMAAAGMDMAIERRVTSLLGERGNTAGASSVESN